MSKGMHTPQELYRGPSAPILREIFSQPPVGRRGGKVAPNLPGTPLTRSLPPNGPHSDQSENPRQNNRQGDCDEEIAQETQPEHPRRSCISFRLPKSEGKAVFQRTVVTTGSTPPREQLHCDEGNRGSNARPKQISHCVHRSRSPVSLNAGAQFTTIR